MPVGNGAGQEKPKACRIIEQPLGGGGQDEPAFDFAATKVKDGILAWQRAAPPLNGGRNQPSPSPKFWGPTRSTMHRAANPGTPISARHCG